MLSTGRQAASAVHCCTSNKGNVMEKKWALTALIAVLIVAALLRIDAASLAASIQQVPLRLILLLIGLQIVSQLLVNAQWYRIANIADVRISFRDMLYVNCQGAVVDAITPGVKFGGEITRAVRLNKISGCGTEAAAAVVALQKIFSISALLAIQLFTVGHLFGMIPRLQAVHMQVLIFGVLLLFLLILAGVFFMAPQIMQYLQKREEPQHTWLRRVRSFVYTLAEHIYVIRGNKASIAAFTILSVAIWVLYPGKMYLIAMQFAPEISWAYIAAITFAAYMVAMLPIFPGGLGGFEATMAGLLVVVGFAASDAAVITIVFRFVTFWLVMLLSLLYCAIYRGRTFVRSG
ncbi:MAG: flippase-like domain-containing protein [Defluviitaleaceae bacterium]|nr:flippase-like domain-containing protein [Defluviitaleaceae bacterium]